MRENLQTMILPVIGALIGGQITVTRTGKLRKDIRENINLLGQLPGAARPTTSTTSTPTTTARRARPSTTAAAGMVPVEAGLVAAAPELWPTPAPRTRPCCRPARPYWWPAWPWSG
jgi:hypothetical protein